VPSLGKRGPIKSPFSVKKKGFGDELFKSLIESFF
jgi:hypothetical protein